jgi:hypothetical protein
MLKAELRAVLCASAAALQFAKPNASPISNLLLRKLIHPALLSLTLRQRTSPIEV